MSRQKSIDNPRLASLARLARLAKKRAYRLVCSNRCQPRQNSLCHLLWRQPVRVNSEMHGLPVEGQSFRQDALDLCN